MQFVLTALPAGALIALVAVLAWALADWRVGLLAAAPWASAG